MATNDEYPTRSAGSVPRGSPPGADSQRSGDTAPGGAKGSELPPQFGRYLVKKKLGGGGMGAVYLVENTELRREEALKVPHFDAADGPQVRERFLREARAAAGLEHPNLCPVYHVGEQDGVCYLTMRYLKGRPLSDYVDKALPPREAVKIAARLAQALAYAHDRGVIHRDLKPSNVLMCEGVGPVVLDFGLAKQVQQVDQKLTQSGAVLGTPAYMSPEQVKGEAAGPASDVYSLGVILHELLTGQPLFGGASAAEVFGRILFAEPPPPSALRPEVGPALDAVCRKALAKDPAGRYASMKDFAAALAEYLRAAPAMARPAPANVPPSQPSAPPASRADRTAADPLRGVAVTGKRSSRPWDVVLAGLELLVAASILIVLAAAGLYFALRPSSTNPAAALPGPSPAESKLSVPPREGGGPLTLATPRSTPAESRRAEPPAVADAAPKRERARPDLLDCTGAAGVSPAQIKGAQAAWARYLGREVEEEDEIAPGVKMAFVLVPPGKFLMGSPPGEPNRRDDELEHAVTITEPFYLGKYEVTQAQYAAAVGAGADRDPSNLKGADLPVEQVSWDDASAYAAELTKRRAAGVTCCLPTEAEWEYACRGGRPASQPFGVGDGTTLASDQANFDRPQITRVGSFPPNALGLHDLHGNVWEWCADRYAPYPAGDATNPFGPAEGPSRAIRGGGWIIYGAGGCRAASRLGYRPDFRYKDVGFRLARIPPGNRERVKALEAEAQARAGNARPDPGNLTSLQDEVGKTFYFRVTGAVSGTVWGTGVYTSDSPLATVAVHAGLLQVGQTGVVKVTIVPAQAAYTGSTQNGVTTSDYGPWPGAYRVSR